MLMVPSFDQFMQAVANAISLGSMYALIAIGYTMVYGILRLINFAHGDMLMVAMYFAFYCVTLFMMPWYIALALAIIGTTLLGIGVEKIAYKPLRSAPRISLLISAIGMSYLLENLAVVIFGGIPKNFPAVSLFQDTVVIGTVVVQRLTFIVPIVTAVLVIILLRVINHTKLGMSMRAASVDYPTSRMMGINVDRVISFTFAIGSALAAVGALFWMFKYNKMDPYVGMLPGLKCFIASVLGGIGNVTGAVLGGVILAFIEIMVVLFFPSLSGFKDSFAFIVLILVLLFKPNGLLGEIGGADKA